MFCESLTDVRLFIFILASRYSDVVISMHQSFQIVDNYVTINVPFIENKVLLRLINLKYEGISTLIKQKTTRTIGHLIATFMVGIVMMLAASLQVDASSAVNTYILNHKLTPANVTKQIWSGFPKNKYTSGKPTGVVVHETGNPNSTIFSEIAYMKQNYQNAFVHSYVDASRVINIADTSYLAWGCAYPGNGEFIQFEQVEVHSKAAFAKEVNNAANYTAELLHQYNLPLNDAAYDGQGTVWSHNAVSKFLGGTDHTDPTGYYATSGKQFFGQAYTMSDFYQLVKHYYNAADTSNSTSASHTTMSSKGRLTSSDKVAQPVTIRYHHGQGTESARLNSNYQKFRLYNHVKGSDYFTFYYNWNNVLAKSGQRVYLDARGVKSPTKTTWYRVRFAKAANAQKYWIYAGALNFNPIEYSNSNRSITIKHGRYALRNHVYGSEYLSLVTGSAKSILKRTYKANKKAVKTYPTGKTTWYRFKLKGHNVWICQQAL